MEFKARISHLNCIFVMLLAAPYLTVDSKKVDSNLLEGMDRLGRRLFGILSTAEENLDKNIAMCPFSIETNLIMTRMGADGETALQIDQAFNLPSQDRFELASKYNTILAEYENSTVLESANKIYAMTGYKVRCAFKSLLTEQLYSSLEFINFNNNKAAAQSMNSWVEQRTSNMIQNLVDPSSLNSATRLVMINTMQFIANWKYTFYDVADEEDFHLDDTKTVKVRMIDTEQKLGYLDLPKYNMTIVEIPYKDTNLAMLIILPYKGVSLAQCEKNILRIRMSSITSKIESTKVVLKLPKFKTVFEAELKNPLSEAGMSRMFSGAAEFGNMLVPSNGLEVSSMVHKVSIEVNERGTAAVAATSEYMIDRVISKIKYVTCDRPFHYVIKNEDNLVLFRGNVKNPNL